MRENREDLSKNIEGVIDWEVLLRDVFRQWLVILLVALACGLLFGTFRQVSYRPQYETSCTFVVGKSGFSSNMMADNLKSAEIMTARFSQITGSSVLKKAVCQELGTESFEAGVRVSVVEASNLMTLSVTADSPRNAYLYIRSVMENALELSEEMAENISVRVLQEPSVPEEAVNPLRIGSDMMKAAAVSAVAMSLLFAVLSYLKDTVKNEDDLKNKVDAKHLGTICHEKKRKVVDASGKKTVYSLVIDNPSLSFSYVEGVRMAATRVQRELDKKGGKVLMVTSVTENEGKSTAAANLALALQQQGSSVLLIDCDFRQPSQYKLFDIPEAEQKKNDLGTALKNKEKVKIVNAGAEKKLPVVFGTRSHRKMLNQQEADYLQRILEHLKKQVDYIILDSSPLAFVPESEVLANMADASLLVVRQDLIEACYINDTIDRLNATNGKVLGCIFNNVRTGFLNRSREYGYYYGGYGSGKYGAYEKSKQSKRQVE